jgi:hypothetical protein
VAELFDSKDIRAYVVFYTQFAAPHVAPHVEPAWEDSPLVRIRSIAPLAP